jgi:hypothetical protein
MAQKVEVEDFSGGITDYYLSAPPNKVKQCDNLLINQYQDQGKVFTRPGSVLYDSQHPRVGTNSRINTCFHYQGKLYAQSADKLYYYNSSAIGDKWVEIKGPSPDLHVAFPGATGNDTFTYANWNYHTFIGNSTSLGYPMKIVVTDNPLLRQAGLPKFDSDLTDPKSKQIKTTFTSVTSGGKNYLYKFVYSYNYSAGVSISFKDIGTPSLPVEVINFGSSTDPTVAIGSPEGPISAVNTFGDLPLVGSSSVTYFVKDTNKYYKWTTEYVDITISEELYNRIRFSVKFENIPVLTNDANTNWPLDVRIDVYRTLNNGTTYFYCGFIDNGETEFTDSLPDSTLPILAYDNKAAFPATGTANYLYYARDTKQYFIWLSAISTYILWDTAALETNEELYTNGGVVANDPPPRCKSIHIRNDIAYYGNCENEYFRLRQSIQGDPDSCPESFYVDVDDDIIAVSSTKNNVIILCKNYAYRVDGFFDELGRGGMTVERISDTAGCLNSQCAVQALDGVLWLGKDAVYYTDGFKVLKLNQDYDQTYKTFVANDNNNKKIQGKYDSKKNRVWWTIPDSNTNDLSKCYVLDLNWGIRENATFTTVSGASFVPCAIEFINGDMIRCDKYGYVLVHRDGIYVDPKINPDISVANWINETIIYTLETASYNFGTSATRKYVTQANITCESNTNVALQIVSNNDDNRVVANLLPIRYKGNILWGEPDVYWGDVSLEWNKQGLIHEKRLMPAKSLRCNYKSLKFTNAKVALLSSDTIGTVTVDNISKTAILTNITSYDWPDKAVGYFISFEEDGYTKEYEIITRTNDSLVFNDPLNQSVSGLGQKWVMRGKPQGEALNLLNFSIIYDISGPSQNAFRTAESGEVNS